MGKYNTSDNFYYPDTEIPRNKLNIKNLALLDEIEKQLFDLLYMKRFNEFPSDISAKYISNLHFTVFSGLYKWAGQYRNVDVSKGDTRFANWKFLDGLMREWEINSNSKLSEFDGSVESMASITAFINIEFIAVHPFREGNGRVIRFLLDQVAVNSGFDKIWGNQDFSDAFQREYIEASSQGVNLKDYRLMESIIKRNLRKL